MKETIKKAFLWWIVFLWTVITWFIGFATWSDLPTQTNNSTLTADIWNEVVTKINTLWAQVDTIPSLWVNQSRQQFNVWTDRKLWTLYTNTTGKPIFVSVTWYFTTNTGGPSMYLYVDGVIADFFRYDLNTSTIITLTAIVPNNSTYKFYISWSTISITKWTELR